MRLTSALMLAAIVVATPVLAQEHEHPEGQPEMSHNRHLLLGADSLALLLGTGRVVVIHVGRGDSAYLSGHVPGARFLPLSAVSATVNGLANEFPAPDVMAAAFSALAIPDSARIVLYGDDAGLLAARAWVALDLMGHGERAALLDGGLVAWRAGGRRIEPGPIALAMVHIPFVPRWQSEKLVDAAWVRAHLGDSTVLLLDSRPADQYAGAEPPCRPGASPCTAIPEQRRGHIPGARNLFWMNALESGGNPVLKPMSVLHHEQWQPLGSDAPGVRTIVTYCRSGVQASHSYFVARYIGYPDVRIYDGSFAEWASLPAGDYPVEREPAHGGPRHH